VKLIAPQLVKPYVKRGKNDAADAEALCEAMSRPSKRFVPVKTAERQTALMLVGLRDRLIRNRTQLANAIRGYAAEFGLAAAKGIAHLVPLLDRIQADESLPGLARELFAIHAKEYAQLQAQIEEVEAKLMTWHKTDRCSRRIAQIPGVGPIGAAILVVGATAVIRHLRNAGSQSILASWLEQLLKRKPPKLVAVALANKLARIAWKLMVTGETYAAKSAPAALAVAVKRSARYGEQELPPYRADARTCKVMRRWCDQSIQDRRRSEDASDRSRSPIC
jgi:transposase